MPVSLESLSLTEFLNAQPRSEIKLHLGCGGERWGDFINVDLYPYDTRIPDSSRSGCVADVLADIRQLGLGDGTIDQIFTAHTLEHFVRWETMDMLGDWHRMLRPGGKLVVEMPDLLRCILWMFHPMPLQRRLARTQFYGNQWDKLDYETHRYVWSAREFKRALTEIGFTQISLNHRTLTHYKWRDMRAVAIK